MVNGTVSQEQGIELKSLGIDPHGADRATAADEGMGPGRFACGCGAPADASGCGGPADALHAIM